MKKTKRAPIIGVIWKTVFNAFKKDPVILAPFCISGALKLVGLLIVFLLIFFPLSIVFGPIIKTLWGEQFLHYPFNFLLMPKLFYYVQIGVYVLLDGLLSAMAVWMVAQANDGKRPNLKKALKAVFPKYLALLGFLLSVFLIVRFISYGENFLIWKSMKFKLTEALLRKGLMDSAKVFLNFFIIVLIETAFAFVIPFLVLEKRGFFKAIGGSFGLARRLFLAAFTLIIVPTFISLPISLLKTGLPILMDKTLPEITFVVLGLGVLVTVAIDSIVTASLAFLFLLKKELGA